MMICHNLFSRSNNSKPCSQQQNPLKISRKSLKKEAQDFPKKTLMHNLMIQQGTFQIMVMTVKVFFLR